MLSRRTLLATIPALLIPAAARAAFEPTPRSTEGPFYPATLPEDDDNDLVKVEGAVREAGGEVLHLAGQVMDRAGTPKGGVRVEIWQCDANGVYLHPNDRGAERRDAGFQGFGHATTDGDGRFSFRTIVPVPYAGRTPHIHMKALADGRELLTTQLYRAGFPRNERDFLFRRLSPAERERASMQLTPRDGGNGPSFDARVRIVV